MTKFFVKNEDCEFDNEINVIYNDLGGVEAKSSNEYSKKTHYTSIKINNGNVKIRNMCQGNSKTLTLQLYALDDLYNLIRCIKNSNTDELSDKDSIIYKGEKI